LLFTKAVELAKMKTDFLAQYSKDTNNAAAIHDYVAYAEIYYWLLIKLYDGGAYRATGVMRSPRGFH